MGPHAELAALHRSENGREMEQTRQELGVNNPEQGKSPKQDPVPSVSFICRVFSASGVLLLLQGRVSSYSVLPGNFYWEKNDSSCFGSTLVEFCYDRMR